MLSTLKRLRSVDHTDVIPSKKSRHFIPLGISQQCHCCPCTRRVSANCHPSSYFEKGCRKKCKRNVHWSQALDESQKCPEVRHEWFDLMGKLWIFFRADLPERKKRFPSWAGAKNYAANLNFDEKNRILVATGPGPCQIEVTNLHFFL